MNERIPTVVELMAAYVEVARIERAKNDRPSVRTVTNVLMGVRHICRECGVDIHAPISELTRNRLDRYVATACDRGHQVLTAWTYLRHLQALVARWTRPYYADRGWLIPALELPICRRRSSRYERPRREVLFKIRDWYESLLSRPDKRDWLAVTLMLELGMRNGDVGRLRWAQFVQKRLCDVAELEGRHDQKQWRMVPCLCYVPHKTSLSSSRRVNWPIAQAVWRQIGNVRNQIPGELVVPRARDVFRRLNAELRGMKLFSGSKACYELRKICIDHVYQNFGAERASAISGDDIRTVTRYYADPSIATVMDVRIIDLL